MKFREHPDSEPELVNTYFAPTFEGFRIMAAALLESFGYAELSVPRSLDVSLLPGVVTNWKTRLRPNDDRLDADSVARLVIDDTWTELTLPQHDKLSRRLAQPGRSFIHHDRARGFATHLTDADDQIMQAVSYVESETDRDVFFNTGARLLTIWLNGEKIFDSDNPWGGWHPGKERIPAKLRAGRNQVVIESLDAFFLSITGKRDWALPSPSKSNLQEEHSPHGFVPQAVDLHVFRPGETSRMSVAKVWLPFGPSSGRFFHCCVREAAVQLTSKQARSHQEYKSDVSFYQRFMTLAQYRFQLRMANLMRFLIKGLVLNIHINMIGGS